MLAKRKFIIIISIILTIVLSIGALSYSWFIRQAEIEDKHKFPATGFEILTFETDVSETAKEGVLYPATLKESCYHNGSNFDNYSFFPGDDLPDYLEKGPGVVSFNADLSYWSGAEEGNLYKAISTEYEVKIKQNDAGTNSERILTKTGEVGLSFEYIEHDNVIYASENSFTIRRAQLKKEGGIVFKNKNGYNIYVKPESEYLIDKDYKKVIFGEYNNAYYSKSGGVYTVTHPNEYASQASENSTDYKINFLLYKNSIYTKEQGKYYFENSENFGDGVLTNSLECVYVDNRQGADDSTPNVGHAYLSTQNFQDVKVYGNTETKKTFVKTGAYMPKTNERLIFNNGSTTLSFNESYGVLNSQGLFLKDMIAMQNQALYLSDNVYPETSEKVLELKLSPYNTVKINDSNLVYYFLIKNNENKEIPTTYYISTTYAIKPNRVGYVEKEHTSLIRHADINLYSPKMNDKILYVHGILPEVQPGDMGSGPNGQIIDETRVTVDKLLVSNDVVVYSRVGISTRFCELISTYVQDPGDTILLSNGNLVPRDTDVSGLMYKDDAFYLRKVHLLPENTVAIRSGFMRVFTQYDPQVGDVVIFKDNAIVVNDIVNGAAIIKSDDIGYYVDNVRLEINDYAYKSLTNYANYVETSIATEMPLDPNHQKAIVWKTKLIMMKDSTFFMNMMLFLKTIDQDTSRDLINATIVLTIKASFDQ